MAEVKRELFPTGLSGSSSEFRALFDAHGVEVVGRPFEFDYARYSQLQKQGRLVWVVAREDMLPIGYCLSFWYRDLHFCLETHATDDLWYVLPDFRFAGVGTRLKKTCHEELQRHGVRRVHDNIRDNTHSTLMGELGFERWGTRWRKNI